MEIRGRAVAKSWCYGDVAEQGSNDRNVGRASRACFARPWKNRPMSESHSWTGVRWRCVRDFPDAAKKWQISAKGGTAPLWRRDGKEILYVETHLRPN